MNTGSQRPTRADIKDIRWRWLRPETALPKYDHDQLLAVFDALLAADDALNDRMTKAHEYGLWIARLEKMPPSHSDPIEECKSPGCVRARASLLPRGEVKP